MTQAQYERVMGQNPSHFAATGAGKEAVVGLDTIEVRPGSITASGGLGLFDTHGNVWEWMQDWWAPGYYSQFQDKPAIDPSGSAGSMVVLKGADWSEIPAHCRASSRIDQHLETWVNKLGFRVALAVDAVKQAIKTPEAKPAQQSAGWDGWPKDTPAPAIAPFDAAQARAYQAAWAAHLGVPVQYTNSIGMKFVLIPPGEFTMGSTPEEIEEALPFAGDDTQWQGFIRSEAPRHKVILTQPIYLGVYEVTQAQYERMMGRNPSRFAATGADKELVVGIDTQAPPVETVTWNEAAEFCSKLSEKENLKPKYSPSGEILADVEGTGYRLPTEAQWEFACRAGTTTKYWIGDSEEQLVQTAWFGANSGGRTHAVGELKENPFGLYDMHGNVWEWVQDGWEPNYYTQFQEQPALNPSGPTSAGAQRVLRGGVYSDSASDCRASFRRARPPTHLDLNIGFRVALTVDAVKAAIASQPAVTSPEVPGFGPGEQLFDGKSLAGWKTHPDQPGEWSVQDGLLTGRGPISHLFSERGDFEDFHVRVEARLNAGGNSGLFFRSDDLLSRGQFPSGYEAQLLHRDPPLPGNSTGTLATIQPGKDTVIKPDEWFTIEAIVQGNHIVIKVDGVITVDYVDPSSRYKRGHFGLQLMDQGSIVQFRKIEVRVPSAG